MTHGVTIKCLQGGIQIYARISTVPTSRPFSGSKTTIDEIIFTENITLGGGEMRVVAQGLNGRAIFTFFISVECSPGYGGDDCLSVNTCSEQIACNLALGYCNTARECVCHDGTTQCRTNVTKPNGTTNSSSIYLPGGSVSYTKLVLVLDCYIISSLTLPTSIIIRGLSNTVTPEARRCSKSKMLGAAN